HSSSSAPPPGLDVGVRLHYCPSALRDGPRTRSTQPSDYTGSSALCVAADAGPVAPTPGRDVPACAPPGHARLDPPRHTRPSGSRLRTSAPALAFPLAVVATVAAH